MHIWEFSLILVTGILAGFLNVLAGGGSLLTMPIMIFLGLPPAVANGTNRIAIIIQNIVAIFNFRKSGYFDWKLSILLGIPAILGSILGANLAISLSDDVFNKILAIIMFMVLAFMLWKPTKSKDYEDSKVLSIKQKSVAVIAFFFVGIYGGFIQAGVGFIIIAALSLIANMSLVRINSIKVFVVLIYLLSSFFVFVINGQVNWLLGFALAIGNAIGGWIGSNFAVNKGDKWIKIVLAIGISAMAIKLLLS